MIKIMIRSKSKQKIHDILFFIFFLKLCLLNRENNEHNTYLMILNDVTARRFIVLYGLIINCSTCVPVAKSNT